MTLPFGVGGVFYINLEQRQDRRDRIENELNNMGIPFERFPAIKKKPGILGCGQSHLAVLKEAQKRGYESVLIFEDDFQFIVDKDTFWKTIEGAAKSISSFDVIMLGYYVQKSETFSDFFDKVHDGQTASAYIVHSRMYTKLIELYEWAMPLLESTGCHWIYANDQIWKRLQPASEWYALKPRVGKQGASYSDCGESEADYGI